MVEKHIIDSYSEAVGFITDYKNSLDAANRVVAFDIETKDLSLKENKLLGFGLAFSDKEGAYIIVRNFSYEQTKNLLLLVSSLKSKIVLHNAYFDITQINYMYDMNFKWNYDTYIIAHALHSNVLLYSDDKERADSLSLKALCKIYYRELYGYEDELNSIKQSIVRENKIKLDSFTYDMFSDDVLAPYGVYDVVVTYRLFQSLVTEVKEAEIKGWEVAELIKLKHDVTRVYIKAKVDGVKIDRKVVLELHNKWVKVINAKRDTILENPLIQRVEGITFNNKYKKELEKRLKEFEEKVKQGKYANEKKYQQAKARVNSLTQARINKLAEESKFNLNSSKQKKILFLEVLNLKPLSYNKKDKQGNKTPKTDKEFLEAYRDIPIINDFLEYSLYIKGVTGFLGVESDEEKGLWHLTSEDYPINHANSNLQGTITHRIAQNSVNFQQLPSRGALSELKKCVIPRYDNHRIVAFDYSSAELYILGALANEPKFIEAIKNGMDLHSSMAFNIWGSNLVIDKELVDKHHELSQYEGKSLKELEDGGVDKVEILNILKNYFPSYRQDAKAVGFGLPYGIGDKGLAVNIGKSVQEARKVLDDYMAYNTNVKAFMDTNKDFLCDNGYIEGKHKQRLYMDKAKGYDWRAEKSYKEKDWKAISELRKSTNYIIQSENAMVLYKGLVNFFKEVNKLKLDKKILLMTTIYDAVYLSVDLEISDDFINNLLKKHFEVDYFNGVKFKIDISSGKNMKEV